MRKALPLLTFLVLVHAPALCQQAKPSPVGISAVGPTLNAGRAEQRVDREFEIFKVVLDKGLLAIVVAAFAWILARSIEHLKASLSWSGELLKQRMDAAKRILKEMQKLRQVHLQVLGGHLVEGSGADPRDLFSAIRSVQELRIELSILQAGRAILGAIDQVVKLADDIIGSQFPGTPGRLLEGKDGALLMEQPSEERAEWGRQKQEQMEGAMRDFESELAKGFPS